jgi:hypothetical protein
LIRKALGLKQKRMRNVGLFRSTAQEGFSGPKRARRTGAGLPYPRTPSLIFCLKWRAAEAPSE